MSTLVSETAERYGPAMDLNGKDLEVDVSNEKLMVFSDKEAVTKILSNLFNNALKYASKNIRVVLKESEGIVAVSVSSDGTKITEKERNLIFEPFYQSEGNAEKKTVSVSVCHSPVSLPPCLVATLCWIMMTAC